MASIETNNDLEIGTEGNNKWSQRRSITTRALHESMLKFMFFIHSIGDLEVFTADNQDFWWYQVIPDAKDKDWLWRTVKGLYSTEQLSDKITNKC